MAGSFSFFTNGSKDDTGVVGVESCLDFWVDFWMDFWMGAERDIFLGGLRGLEVERGMMAPSASWKVVVVGFNELLSA